MKSKVFAPLLLLLLGWQLYAQTVVPSVPAPLDRLKLDDHLTFEIRERTNSFRRLTDQPIQLFPPYAVLCKRPHSDDHSPHDFAFAHVYMNLTGLPSLTNGLTAYPVGTIVLKEKRAQADSKVPQLFTGMLKREKGYNPDAGDWEFFTLDSSAMLVTARGKINSCMDCHSKHQKTDYLTQSWKKSPASVVPR